MNSRGRVIVSGPRDSSGNGSWRSHDLDSIAEGRAWQIKKRVGGAPAQPASNPASKTPPMIDRNRIRASLASRVGIPISSATQHPLSFRKALAQSLPASGIADRQFMPSASRASRPEFPGSGQNIEKRHLPDRAARPGKRRVDPIGRAYRLTPVATAEANSGRPVVKRLRIFGKIQVARIGLICRCPGLNLGFRRLRTITGERTVGE